MAKKSSKDGSQQSTKQMLDELDALMERMLALPVNELEDNPAPAPQPVMSATLTLLDPHAPAVGKPMPAPVAEPKGPERAATASPELNPPHFALPAGYAQTTPSYSTEPEPLTNAVLPPSMLPPVDPVLDSLAETEVASTTQYLYLPLMWINDRFDHVAAKVPVLGALLRSQVGRSVLGFAGILLTATAGGLLLKDWLGWK